MPKVSKVGRFRATSAASSRGATKSAPATTSSSGNTPSPLVAEHAVAQRQGKKAKGGKLDPEEAVAAAAAAAGPSGGSGGTEPTNKQVALSRGQRKRQAKRDQYLKKERMVMSSLKLRHEDEQKERIDGLDALKEALAPIAGAMMTSRSSEKGGRGSAGRGEEEEEQQQQKQQQQKQQKQAAAAVPCVGTNRAKKNLAGREVAHMNLVLQHPTFQSNPFGTIQEHLRNTLASQAAEQEETHLARTKEEKVKEAEKKEVRKEKRRAAKVGTKKRRRPIGGGSRSGAVVKSGRSRSGTRR